MASVKIILRKDKARKNGDSPIYIRMTVDRKSKYISTKLAVAQKYWDEEKQRVKKSHPNAALLNTLLAEKKAEIEKLALEMESGKTILHKATMRNALSDGGPDSFFDFADTFINRLKYQGRVGTVRGYSNTLKDFRSWLKKEKKWDDLSFGKFTSDIGRSYKAYLENERGNRPNTVTNKIAALKSIISYAREVGAVKVSYAPLKGIKLRTNKTTKIIPTTAEIAKLENLELEPGSFPDHTRNMFLFAARMAGLRFSDVVSLKWMQVAGENLHWKTHKTNKQRVVYMPDAAREILAPYHSKDAKPTDFVFPLLQGYEAATVEKVYKKVRELNTSCNATLKRISKKAGFSHGFTFHSSRHFFATDFLRKGGRVEILQYLLTHSKISQTMEYVHIVGEDMNKGMREYEAARNALQSPALKIA